MNIQLMKKILKFEILYKIVTIILIDPIISFLLQRYLDSLGSSSVYNQNILFVFLSIKGMILLLLFLIFATCYIYLELSVLTYLLYFQKQDLSIKEIMTYSFYKMSMLKNKFFLILTIYLILLIPFVHIGFISSLFPSIHIPHFIISELQLNTYGHIFVILFYMFCYLLYFIMMFVPLFMLLKEENIIESIKHSISLQKRMTLKELIILYFPLFLWIFFNHLIQYAPHYLLTNKDFNRYFLRQFLFSSYFRLSFIQYILIFFITLLMMIFFYYHLYNSFIQKEDVCIEYHSYHQDPLQYFQNIKELLLDTFNKIIQSEFSQKYKKQLKIFFYICLVIFLVCYFDQTPLVHRPWIIGHRGDIQACENSKEAVVKADENHADYAEIDVQLSKDKVPVVIHDEKLSRLANINKEVKNMTYQELRSVIVHSRGSEAHISSLDEMIKTAKNTKNKIGLLIELKAADNFNELADKIIEVVENNQFEDKSIFMSFDLNALQYMQNKRPEWWIGYCVYGSLGVIDLDLDMKFLAVEENRINTRFLEAARSHYIPVYVWSVEDETKIYQYLNMGVSGIIGNDTHKISTLVQTYENTHHESYLYNGNDHPW